MPDLTTLYQAVARGGGWSRASRTGGLFVGGANKKRMSRDNCRCIGGGVSIHPSKLPGAGLGLFGDVTFQPGDWITAMDGVVFGGPDSVPENVRRGRSESHFCTLHYGTLCLDGRRGSHLPHGVGVGRTRTMPHTMEWPTMLRPSRSSTHPSQTFPRGRVHRARGHRCCVPACNHRHPRPYGNHRGPEPCFDTEPGSMAIRSRLLATIRIMPSVLFQTQKIRQSGSSCDHFTVITQVVLGWGCSIESL